MGIEWGDVVVLGEDNLERNENLPTEFSKKYNICSIR